jgi:hypothetical protein
MCLLYLNWIRGKTLRSTRANKETVTALKSISFWNVTPCSLLSCNRRFGGTYRLHLQGRRNNFSKNQQASKWLIAEIISFTLKMEAICSSETSVATQETTRRHIPEDDIIHNYRCENLKSYIVTALVCIPEVFCSNLESFHVVFLSLSRKIPE